ncbi:MAG TPA: alpha/beta hydrolase [Rhodoblastus sp.]|mgnify:CR=1 FL=1|nr:alpha/beta hydrolase [Rhodoblastus sp.]
MTPHDLDIAGHYLEGAWWGPGPAAAPTLVLLHEGLGCVGLWGDFPAKLARATGCGVFAYSRAGYGKSSPIPLPRPLTYMHDEARETLPQILDAIGFRTGALVGHSDGASIALIHAGAIADPRVKAVALMAPHVFTEELGLASIRQAREAYEQGDLKRRLARWHAHVDCAFHGWNGAWLDPGFRQWNLEEFLPRIRIPMQVIQGEADQYGTMDQVRAIARGSGGPVETALIPGIGHSPYREAPEATLEALTDFLGKSEIMKNSAV